MTLEELVSAIYLAMGLTSETLPQTTVEAYILLWQDTYPDNDCQVMYNTILSLYSWLIKSSAADNTGGGKIREREGSVEIEHDKVDKSSDWESARDEFVKNPWESLPQCRVEFTKSSVSPIILGGVRKDEVSRVRRDTNRFSQYSERSPYSPRRKRYRSLTNINSVDEDC
jgi:hypothetical protein